MRLGRANSVGLWLRPAAGYFSWLFVLRRSRFEWSTAPLGTMDQKRKNDLAYLIDRKAEAILAEMDPESIVAEMKVAYPNISEEELVSFHIVGGLRLVFAVGCR
jgi:hypothetical protein